MESAGHNLEARIIGSSQEITVKKLVIIANFLFNIHIKSVGITLGMLMTVLVIHLTVKYVSVGCVRRTWRRVCSCGDLGHQIVTYTTPAESANTNLYPCPNSVHTKIRNNRALQWKSQMNLHQPQTASNPWACQTRCNQEPTVLGADSNSNTRKDRIQHQHRHSVMNPNLHWA